MQVMSDERTWVDHADVIVATGRIDFARSRFVARDGSVTRLTTREAELLACLAAAQGRAVPREHLLRAVWRHHSLSLSRAVDATVARLRKKIERAPHEVLFTEHGSGYRLLTAHAAREDAHDAPPRRVLALGERSADLSAGHVDGPRGRVALTTRERLVLEQLARTPGVCVDADVLARRSGITGGRQALANAVHRLRTKLEADPSEPRFLATIRGTGYRLDATVSEPVFDRGARRDALRSLTEHVGAVLGLDDCVVYTKAGDVVRQVAAYGPKRAADGGVVAPLTQRLGEGLVGCAAQAMQPIVVDDVRRDARYLRDLHPARAELAVPIMRHGRVVGVLDSEAAELGAFGARLVTAFISLAAIAAMTLGQDGE